MKNRVLFVVGVSAIFLALILRLLWPAEEFVLGLSVALHVSGIALLVLYGIRYFSARLNTRAP
jgi:hypothetical protein